MSPETTFMSQTFAAAVSNCDSLCHVLSQLTMMSLPSSHIVVVDDEPKVRTLLRRVFEPEGFRVSEASGSEALFALLRTEHVDLVTLDLTLHNEDGLEVARRIRAESRVPIIMVTGKGDMIDRVVGLELG